MVATRGLLHVQGKLARNSVSVDPVFVHTGQDVYPSEVSREVGNLCACSPIVMHCCTVERSLPSPQQLWSTLMVEDSEEPTL